MRAHFASTCISSSNSGHSKLNSRHPVPVLCTPPAGSCAPFLPGWHRHAPPPTTQSYTSDRLGSFLLLCTRSLSLCPISDWIRLISLPNNLGIVFLHPCCHSYLNDNFSHLDYFYSLPAHLPAFQLLLPFICSQLGSPSDLHARHIWSIPSSTDNISMALCCSQDNDQIPQMP